jgi:hypothetical protein
LANVTYILPVWVLMIRSNDTLDRLAVAAEACIRRLTIRCLADEEKEKALIRRCLLEQGTILWDLETGDRWAEAEDPTSQEEEEDLVVVSAGLEEA